MKKRNSIICLLSVMAGWVVAAPPNIVFCLADDWGWPHAGAYGDRVVKTPVFDRLAKEGVLFEHAYVSVPSCTPCRNSILTGQQFYRLKQGANLYGALPVGEPNFMFLLRASGYEIGHWRKAWGPGNFEQGGYTEHPCGPGTSFEKFMSRRDKDKPFCFWFGTSDPHRGYETGSGRRSGIDVDKIHVPKFLPDTDEVRSDMADYYFEVQRWDRDVGAALKLLEEQGELENTIVVMTGDHGMPFPRCKGNLYDWGTRVPLAVRWGEKIKAGQVVTDFASFTDFAPTFLAAAGLDIPVAMTGRSLLPCFKNESNLNRGFVVAGRERHVPAQKEPSLQGYPSRSIRTKKWLLILNLEPDLWPAGIPSGSTFSHRIERFADCDDGPSKSAIVEASDSKYFDLCFGRRGAVELYDCENDPDQVHNQADNPELAEVVEVLRGQLVAYLKDTRDPRFTNQPVLFDEFSFRAK